MFITALSSIIALLVLILIPAIQFGIIYKLWDDFNLRVSREYCTCSCWDTVFKATYERGISGYKHVYFNATWNTLVIWILTVIVLIAFYEALKKVLTAVFGGTARFRMVILFVSVIYSHYYAWWGYFNYFNDDFYNQFWHQTIFTVTEFISTILILHLIDASNSIISARKILIIMSIAIFHVIASGWDQFVENVVKGEGQMHQVLRDLGFMIPDLLHIGLPWMELAHFARKVRRVPPSHLIKTLDFIAAVVGILSMWLLVTVTG